MDKEKPTSDNSGLAVVSLIAGILSILVCLLVWLSLLLGVAAIVCGVISLKSAGRGKAIAGIVTGSIGIVLSILVFLIGFFAVPALQQEQTNSARKNDLSLLMSDVTAYESLHQGSLPAASDLSTDDLSQITAVTASGSPTATKALYKVGVDCRGEAEGTRAYSLSILLGDGSVYCLDS